MPLDRPWALLLVCCVLGVCYFIHTIRTFVQFIHVELVYHTRWLSAIPFPVLLLTAAHNASIARCSMCYMYLHVRSNLHSSVHIANIYTCIVAEKYLPIIIISC